MMYSFVDVHVNTNYTRHIVYKFTDYLLMCPNNAGSVTNSVGPNQTPHLSRSVCTNSWVITTAY